MSGAIRDLESIRSRREVEYAVLSALNFFNGSRGDGKTADALDALERAPEKISPAANVLAAQFQWAIAGDRGAARTMLSRVEKVEGLSPVATESLQTALGWLAVTEGVVMAGSKTVVTPSSVPEETAILSSADQTAQDMDAASRAMAFFEAATAAGASKTLPIDAMMGMAAAYERRGDYVRAVDTYTDILNTYNWFVPAACEQARLFCKAGDWDNANDAIARVLEVDATNVECLRLLAHEALLREGSSLRAVARLQDLLNAITKAEPRNAKLYYDVSRVCARLGNRSPAVLSVTLSMLDSASRCEPDNAIYQCETGAQRSLMGDFAGAAAAYREAGRLDESNPDAVPGMISVQIAQGLLDDAESQLEMYRLIAESVTSSRTPQLALLEAQLAWKKGRNRPHALKMLSDAILVWATRLGISGDSINAKGKVVSSSRFRVVPGATPGLAGGDGLPLPMLLPGPASSFYEWYYAACVDPIMYDIARDLLLQQESKWLLHLCRIVAPSLFMRASLQAHLPLLEVLQHSSPPLHMWMHSLVWQNLVLHKQPLLPLPQLLLLGPAERPATLWFRSQARLEQQCCLRLPLYNPHTCHPGCYWLVCMLQQRIGIQL
jgi:tetratricopeptide (TPR) repeat protein